jgi:expansin (peptidoglycan-binding protein)
MMGGQLVRARGAVAAVAMTFAAGCGGGCGRGGSARDAVAEDAASCAATDLHTGEATYYAADGSGNCAFDPSPDDLMVAALNSTDYDGAAACGACVAVDGPAGSVTVRIVDRCPGCAAGDIDLGREAFERIAKIAAGRVDVSWRYVGCDVDGPVRYRFKEGSNAFWTGLQVRNHRYAISTFEARPAGGEWRTVARESYNYFVTPSGLGKGPIDLRITDVHGHVLEDTGIPLGDATEVSGAAQLPACD